MVGNVGNDAFGTQLRKSLEDAGVDTTYVNTVEGASGVALITTGRSGDNNVVVVPPPTATSPRKCWKKQRRFWSAPAFFSHSSRCRSTGAQPSMPTGDEVERFLEEHPVAATS